MGNEVKKGRPDFTLCLRLCKFTIEQQQNHCFSPVVCLPLKISKQDKCTWRSLPLWFSLWAGKGQAGCLLCFLPSREGKLRTAWWQGSSSAAVPWSPTSWRERRWDNADLRTAPGRALRPVSARPSVERF